MVVVGVTKTVLFSETKLRPCEIDLSYFALFAKIFVDESLQALSFIKG